MKSTLIFFTIALAVLLKVPPLLAKDGDLSGLALGVNYSGVGVRYLRASFSGEARLQALGDGGSDESVSAASLRLSKYHGLTRGFFWYGGLEGAYMHYRHKATDISVDGWLTGAFIGIETLIGRRLSWNIDMGPYYGQTFNRTHRSSDVVDVAINTSLNYHLGQRK